MQGYPQSLVSPTPENWTRWKISPSSGEPLLFFERIDDNYWYHFQNNYWWLFWCFVGLYWIIVYGLQRMMRDRAPMSLDSFVFTYNMAIGAFSLLGLWRISTTFFPLIFSGPDGLHKSLCVRYNVTMKDGFWLLAFGWSKLAHFLDTVFTVLKKKPVQFMQMYHHSVVVLVPQHILPYGEPILIWWGVTNLAQHSITYPYLALKCLKWKVPKIASTFIIIVEVVQMLVGLGTGLYTLHVLNSGGDCVRHPKSIFIINFVYDTIGILALHMAYEHFKKNFKSKVKTT